jgi:RNA polymerase sigma factor (sigma-70 family)
MSDDITLLREYAQYNSEEAFAALVSRYVNLVYSVALRDVQDPYLAEEITQAVFIILARKAESFDSKVVLSGWLCRTARYAGANALTIERRRQTREQEAYMQSVFNKPESDAWTQIAPLLGGAMEQLGKKDYDAVVLRFFEGKSFQEIGIVLGASENAAKKRVGYALEKLRKFFFKHGIASTTATIAVALSTNSVHAAPVTLAKVATTVALAKGATASASTITLIKGALKVMAWTNVKTTIGASMAVVLAAGTTALVVQHRQRPNPQPIASSSIEFPRASWAFAGYADPQSAVLSFLWAIKQGDGEKIEGSFTPGLQQKFQRMFAQQMQTEGKSFNEILSQEAPKHFSQNTGIKIIDQKTVPSDQIALRVYVSGEKSEHTFYLKKTVDEWKVNDIQ